MVQRVALLAALLGLAALPAEAQTPGIVTNGKVIVSLSGVGQVKFGMSPKQVRSAAGIHLRSERRGACRYLVDGPPGSIQRTDYRFAGGKLVTVSVHTRELYRTPKGVRKGTPLATLRERYPGMTTKPAIGGGTNHVYAPPSGSDRRFVFLVGNGKVLSFRSGPAPAVMLEECY